MRFVFLVSSVLFLWGCTTQSVKPSSVVYNVTITQTDNSHIVSGDNNRTKAAPVTEVKPVSDIKPNVKAEAEATTKNGMWIYALIATLVVGAAGWLAWRKWGKVAKNVV